MDEDEANGHRSTKTRFLRVVQMPGTRKTKYLWLLLLVVQPAIALAQSGGPNGPFGGAVQALVAYRDGTGTDYVFAGVASTGTYRSTDHGSSWTLVSANVAASFALRARGDGGIDLFVAAGSTVYRSSDNGENWAALGGNFYGQPVIDIAVVVDSTDKSYLFAAVGGEGVYWTTDNGAIWSTWYPGSSASTSLGTVPDKSGGINIFAGFYTGTYRSSDYGGSWLKVDSEKTVQCFGFSGPTLFAGTQGYGVLRSTDEGLTWHLADSGLTDSGSRMVYCLANSTLGTQDTSILAGTQGGMYRSTDNGMTWIPSNNGMPLLDIRSLAVSEGIVYAGTATDGVYRSTDNGKSWLGTVLIDSLVDVFPLDEGNHWTYGWSRRNTDTYAHVLDDTGTVDYVVSHRIETPDSIRWFIMERRNLRKGPPGYEQGWGTVQDSALVEIVEKLDGRHQLVSSVSSFPFLGSYVLNYYTGQIDTTKIYRFARVDSSGHFDFHLADRSAPWFEASYFYSFERNVGLRALTNHTSWGGAHISYMDVSESLREAAFPGPGLAVCDPTQRTLAVTAALGVTSERVVIIKNPGSGTLHLAASCANPHSDLILDQEYVPAHSNTQLHIRYFYTAIMLDTARIVLSSNAASSPDIITMVVNAGGGTQVSFDPGSLYISDNDMGVLGNPKYYPVTITNTSSMPLVIDSVTSDNRSFSCLHRVKMLAAGTSGADTIVFNAQDIRQQTGHLFFYSNSITSPDAYSVRGYAIGAVPIFEPDRIHFVFHTVGVPLEQTVRVRNEGTLDMTSGRLVPASPGLEVFPQTLALYVDQSYPVRVRFTPANSDSQGGMIFIYNHPVPPETLFVSATPWDVNGEHDSTFTKPQSFSLAQNFPNPFNSSTTIRFALPSPARVILKVFDILGQDVATITDEHLGQGTYERNFDASGLASGVYVYKLMAGSFVQSHKMLLMK
jgi:photosystem II stability/assembly factor-like uncharacterized protein